MRKCLAKVEIIMYKTIILLRVVSELNVYSMNIITTI